MIRLLSLFTGIGAFETALRNLNIPYELVGFSEIDKFAIKSYCAIHNVDEEINLGDVKNINTEKIRDVDFMTWGFPCQDISIAGNLKGIEEGKTRSGLYFEGYRILREVMPKVSIIENVKNLTSKRFREKFVRILKDIEDAGYNNYWRILNAKDYGVPQNRERVFVVSIRKDIDKCSFNFPDKQFLKIRLKDLLEDEVDEKYYLSDKAIGRLIKKSNLLIPKQVDSNNDVRRIIGVYDDENKKHQSGSIYDENGLSPTLTSASGGHIQPHIFVKEGKINNIAPTQTGNCGNINSSAAVLISEDGKYFFRIRKLTPKECWRLMRI